MTVSGRYVIAFMHIGLLLVVLAGVLTWLFAEKGGLVLTEDSCPAVMTDDGGVRLPSAISVTAISPDTPSCRIVMENGRMTDISPNHPALIGSVLVFIEGCSHDHVCLLVVDDPWGYSLAAIGCVVFIIASLILLIGHIRGWHVRPLWWQIAVFAVLVLLTAFLLQPSDPALPILRTPWLLIHLVPLVLAYALLPVGLFLSVLIIAGRGGESAARRLYGLLLTMTLLLGTGIALGALWAGVSWGRYWGWDVKETWALIAFIVSAIPVHFKALTDRRRHPRALAVWTVIIVATIVATYFALNPFGLQSLHSY